MSWLALDQFIQQELGVHHGLPIGIGELHITTRDGFLRDLLHTGFPENESAYDEDDELIEFADDKDGSTWSLFHHFRLSRQWRGKFWTVFLFRNQQTMKVRHILTPIDDASIRFELWLATGAARSSSALSSAEEKAKGRLFESLSEVQRDQYLLNDTVLERGRSGVAYMIRKNRPTIAMRQDRPPDGEWRVLCTLCLHPWAYYTGSWAGAMPPSDEVLAHLLYIRTDEHLFWRRANQLSVNNPCSGI